MMEDFKVFADNWFKVYEKRLLANSSQKYIVGDKQTIADFVLFRVGYGYMLDESYPNSAELKPVLEKNEVFHKYILG